MAEFNPDFMRLLQRQLLGDANSNFTPRPVAVDKVGSLINALDDDPEEDEIGALLKAMESRDKQFEATSPSEQVCVRCKKQYSLAFQIKDAKGKPCGKGMHYTVKYKLSGLVREGTTDANGLTKRYKTYDPEEELYLYLGHRTDDDGYPDKRSGDENIYDEAFLETHKVVEDYKNMIHPAQTQRLWKQWTFSQQGIDALRGEEQGIPYIYNDAAPFREGQKLRWDAPGGNPISTTNSRGFTFQGNSTIGYGHLLHKGPVDPNNPLDAPYIERNGMGNDLTQAEMDQIFDADLIERGGTGTGRSSLASRIFVPLHQREYDALVNQTFNGARNRGDIIGNINRGRYTKGGKLFQSNQAAPTQRRQQQEDMFFRGVY